MDDARISILSGEVDRLRANVHELRNKVTELGVYFQESRDDIKELTEVVRALTLKIDTFASTVSATTAAQTVHAEACLRAKLVDREINDKYHSENKVRLDRLENGAIKFLWAVLGLALTATASIALNVAKMFIS